MLILDAIGNDSRPIARTSSKHYKIDKQPTRTIRTRKHKDKSKDNLKDRPTNTYWKRDAPKISSRSSSDLAKSFVFLVGRGHLPPKSVTGNVLYLQPCMYIYIYVYTWLWLYMSMYTRSRHMPMCLYHVYIHTSYVISGQIIIFHEPRFPWNKGSHFPSKTLPFGGNRSCEVAIIWPDHIYI